MTAHAKLSASGAHRWMACPASVKMEEGLPDKASDFALEGTVAHALAEHCLRNEEMASEQIGYLSSAIEGRDFEVTEEMAEAVQVYIDYVRSLKGDLLVEQRVDFSPWVPNGFGTADAIVLRDGKAHVIDLKYGKGLRVDADNNPQAMLYALGALNEYSFIFDEIETFVLTIVQPRLDHVSEWEVSKADLLNWADEASAKAKAAQALLDGDLPPADAFNPGDKQCQWCKAKAQCRALAGHTFTTIAGEFEDFETAEARDITTLTINEVAAILPKVKLFTSWLSAVEAFATHELEQGREVPGYKLVEGRSIRKWLDDDAAEAALLGADLKDDDIFTKKLISPTQAEKLLGKKHPVLEEHCIKPEGKPSLAPESDKRPAITLTPGAEFDQLDEAA